MLRPRIFPARLALARDTLAHSQPPRYPLLDHRSSPKKELSRDESFNGKDSIGYHSWLFLTRFAAPAILAFVLFDMVTA